jgi:hypothetical protein
VHRRWISPNAIHRPAGYVPPPGHDARGVLIEDHRPRRKNKRGKLGGPKRASGAYVFFTNEMRPLILEEYPGIKFVELGKVLGERWRALTPEQKKKFEDMAAQDKIRFTLEMQEFSMQQMEAASLTHPPLAGGGYFQDPITGTISYEPYASSGQPVAEHHELKPDGAVLQQHDPYAVHSYEHHT